MTDGSLEEMFGKAKNPAVEDLCTKIVQNTGVLGDVSGERANVMANGRKVKYISASTSISAKNNPVMRMVEEDDMYKIDHVLTSRSITSNGTGNAGIIIEVLDDE